MDCTLFKYVDTYLDWYPVKKKCQKYSLKLVSFFNPKHVHTLDYKVVKR